MPDTDRDGLPEPRTIIALAERVAVVETKIGALKDDTGVIRSGMHDIKNEQQRSIAVEMRCAQALETMQQLMAERTIQVNKMDASIEAILAAKNQAEGAWAATVRISAAIVASISIIGMLAAGMAWALGHLALR